MSIPNVSGYWTGEISGTNIGSFVLNLEQNGDKITGTANVQEPSIGRYELSVTGSAKGGLSFRLIPVRQSRGFILAPIQVACSLEQDDNIIWAMEV